MGYSKLMNYVQTVQDLLKVVPTSPFVERLKIYVVEDVTKCHVF